MQRIVVQNFGPLENIDIQIKDFTVLIGEQASGKSTLAKLIYFFKSMSDDIVDEIVNANPKKEENFFLTILSTIDERLEKKFGNYFGMLASKIDSTSIKYYFDDKSFVEIKQREGFQITDDTNFTSISYHDDSFRITFLNTIREKYNKAIKADTLIKKIRVGDELRNDLKTVFKTETNPLFIPAGRSISVTYGDLIDRIFYGELVKSLSPKNSTLLYGKSDFFLMQAFLEQVPSLRERYYNATLASETPVFAKKLSKVSQILKGEYKLSNGIEGIQIEKRHVPLSQASTGQQESIRILQDIVVSTIENSHSFKIIEEPEAHLFPNAQKNVIELMVNMINESDNQIFITTHSPYILSYLNNLLFAWKVGQLQPHATNSIAPEFRLNPASFGAYVLRNGTSQTIFDIETGLIDRNYLDEIFEEIGFEYDALYDVYADFVTSNNNQ